MIKIFERNIKILISKFSMAEIMWWILIILLAFVTGRIYSDGNIPIILFLMISYVVGMFSISRYVTKRENRDVAIEKIKLLDNPKFSEEERKEIILNLAVEYLPQSVVTEIDKVLDNGSE